MANDSIWENAYLEGLEFEWDFSYDENDMNSFGEMIQDKNPLHTDNKFAKSRGFESKVVYGLLIASQTSRLIGEELPDKNSILTGLTIDFFNPSYINRSLTFKAKLIYKSNAAKALEFSYRVLEKDKLLCKGSVKGIWRG